MTTPVVAPRSGFYPPNLRGETLEVKKIVVIPEFSAWLTLVLEQCRAENIRNLPRQRAPTPLFPERRPREACSMPISGCHDLPLATFNLPSRNNPQNKRPQPPPSSFRNFRREAGPPTGVAAALSRSDCARRVALAKLRRNYFTPTPAAAPRSGLKPPILPPHRHSGISVARRACLPIGVPGEFFTPYSVAACVC